MDDIVTYITIAITAAGFLAFLFFSIKELNEIQYLKKTLLNVIGKTNITSVDDLVKIKNYLNTTIKYNPELRTKKRPLLRHTATQILQSNYGFCGENARVSIKLLLLGGISARRIYLYGIKWGHVVIEQKINGNWYLFDGHYDPKTKLEDHQVGAIQSEALAAYPNQYEDNDYIDFCRVKLFYKITPLRKYAKLKLPSLVVYLFESPNLIKAGCSILITFAGILLYCITN